jgi:hypothetical protein
MRDVHGVPGPVEVGVELVVDGDLPIGEPMLETCRPWASRVFFALASCSPSRSSTLVPQALRNSRCVIPSLRTSAHCSSRSGEISSENPDRVHMEVCSS